MPALSYKWDFSFGTCISIYQIVKYDKKRRFSDLRFLLTISFSFTLNQELTSKLQILSFLLSHIYKLKYYVVQIKDFYNLPIPKNQFILTPLIKPKWAHFPYPQYFYLLCLLGCCPLHTLTIRRMLSAELISTRISKCVNSSVSQTLPWELEISSIFELEAA